MLNCVVEYLIIFASILTIIVVKLLTTQRKPPIFNVYQRPSTFYWLKVAFMYSILSLRRFKDRKNNKGPTDEELDRPQKLSFHDKAVDAVYFNAGNGKGDYFVTATARRQNKLIDGFLFLKIASSELGVLETPKIPCTSLYKTEDDDEYAAEGLNIRAVVAMKKWIISYSGKLKNSLDSEKVYDVQIDFEWTSDLPYFNFDTDIDPLAMAKNMALEPWSKEYFETLKEAHQSHYEQFGKLVGTAVVNGKTYELNLDSCRDHSFGKKREWGSFHRYGLHYINAENGDRFAICNISVPIMFSSLLIGYIYSTKDKKLYPVKSCDLQLYQHGEGGNPPTDYAFTISAGDRTYTIQINVLDSPFFYISKNWESKVVERLCVASINGVKAWGISEWQYRNIAGRQVGEKKSN